MAPIILLTALTQKCKIKFLQKISFAWMCRYYRTDQKDPQKISENGQAVLEYLYVVGNLNVGIQIHGRYIKCKFRNKRWGLEKFGSISAIAAIWASRSFTALSREHLLFRLTTHIAGEPAGRRVSKQYTIAH